MLSHPSPVLRLEASQKMIPREVSVHGPWSLRFSIVFKMAAAINVPLSQELYSELSLKKNPSHYGWSLMRGFYFTFFLKVPDGGIELMLGINKSTFAKGQ